MKKFIATILASFLLCTGNSQSNCPDSAVYVTKDMGNGFEQLRLQLNFLIKEDSIFILADMRPAYRSSLDVTFKILHKDCHWDKDYTMGYSIYQVISSNSKKGVINITLNNNKGKVQLLYENSEPRIFNIKDD